MEDLRQKIEAYIPWNEQEEKDKSVLLKLLETDGEKALFRENVICHLTASAWVINPERTKILMAYHNIYHAWSWLGGHADGVADLLSVALREVAEESGIRKVKALSENIFSIEVLTVDGHEKRGKYVPSHLHVNVTYLLEADDKAALQVKADENSAVAWFPIDEAAEKSVEVWMRERIYEKLNGKLKEWMKNESI